MLQTLDPHSILLEPKYFKEMKLQTRGEFGGLGFVIGMRDGNLTVMKVLKGTPAQKAGVKAKDVITKIEELSTINMDLQEAVDHIRGKPGTRVNLTTAAPGRGAAPPGARPRAHQRRDGSLREAARPKRRLREGAAVLGQHHPRPRSGHRPAEGAGRRPAPGAHPRPARQPGRAARAGHPGLRPLPLPGRHREDRGRGRSPPDARGEGGARRPRRHDRPAARGARQQCERLGERDRGRRAEEQQPRASSSAARPSARARSRSSTTSPTRPAPARSRR